MSVGKSIEVMGATGVSIASILLANFLDSAWSAFFETGPWKASFVWLGFVVLAAGRPRETPVLVDLRGGILLGLFVWCMCE